MADLPGRRPDLARHLCLAARQGHGELCADGARLAAAPRSVDVVHGIELRGAPAPHDFPPGRRPRSDRDARRLRHRRAPRRSDRGSLVCRRFRRGAVCRDPVLRPALPRLVGRPVPPAGTGAHPAGGFSLGRRRARLRGTDGARAPGRQVPGGGARGDVRRRRPHPEARERAVPARAGARVRRRPALARGGAVRPRSRARARHAHVVEMAWARRRAALRRRSGRTLRPGSATRSCCRRRAGSTGRST